AKRTDRPSDRISQWGWLHDGYCCAAQAASWPDGLRDLAQAGRHGQTREQRLKRRLNGMPRPGCRTARRTGRPGYQLAVRADLNCVGAVQHDDQVGHAYRGEPVRYEDGDAAIVGRMPSERVVVGRGRVALQPPAANTFLCQSTSGPYVSSIAKPSS